MKNKIELKKTIIISILLIALFSIVYGLISLEQYKTYTKNFNYKIEEILSIVQENYPNVSCEELIEILNNKKVSDTKLLQRYGIDTKKDTIILKNQSDFNKFMIINTILIILMGLTVIFIFLFYNYNKDKNIKEITNYIEEINRKNYKLDIEDNTEDELSILKNEIYKTTVMLKEQAENSLQDKINLKDSLSDISHQLKTPLTSINIMLDNILDNPNMDEATRNEFIKDIRREITNINFLVQAILKLSRFDANTINFLNENTKVSQIIDGAIQNVTILADLKNVQININGDESCEIICDKKWQIEALTNILKNAIEHSNENSKIDISYEQNKLYTRILIQDYGIGISKEDLAHIFERFYKGKNTAKESVGIGLPLAKAIVEKNGGRIKVESKINNGTIFEISYL